MAKHSTHRQRSQRFSSSSYSSLPRRTPNRSRPRPKPRPAVTNASFAISSRSGGAKAANHCMFTSYIRRRSTNGSVIPRIDVDDIECYIILLSGRRLLLRDIQFLSPLSSVDLASSCVRLRVSQEDPIEHLDGAFSLLFRDEIRLRLRRCFCRSSSFLSSR